MRREGRELFQQDFEIKSLAEKYYVRIGEGLDFRWKIFGLTAH